MDRYAVLKKDDARSGTSKKYWIESAKSLGFIDTTTGIKLSANRPPPPPEMSNAQTSQGMGSRVRRNSEDFYSSESNTIDKSNDGGNGDSKDNDGVKKEKFADGDKESHPGDPPKKIDRIGSPVSRKVSEAPPLVIESDQPTATEFSFTLLSQMQPCVFTEADRLGKRKGLPTGFAGLACRHCFGGYGSGRFFPSSIKTLSDTSKTLNVLHNHMMRCRKCPKDIRAELDRTRNTHDEERAKMKFGSQKAFFAKIWSRLHDNRPGGGSIPAPSPKSTNGRKSLSQVMMSPPRSMLMEQQQRQQQQHQQQQRMMGGHGGVPRNMMEQAAMMGGGYPMAPPMLSDVIGSGGGGGSMMPPGMAGFQPSGGGGGMGGGMGSHMSSMNSMSMLQQHQNSMGAPSNKRDHQTAMSLSMLSKQSDDTQKRMRYH